MTASGARPARADYQVQRPAVSDINIDKTARFGEQSWLIVSARPRKEPDNGD